MANIWVRKPIAVLQAEAKEGEFGSGGEAQLRRTLSLWSLVALGIGAIIGAGIFVLTGHAAAANAGPAISLSFVLAGIVCAFAGLCYAEMASTVPIAGSAYTYAYATMGEFIAWVTGWTLILEYAFGATTVAIGWSGYVTSFLRDLGVVIPAEFALGPLDYDPASRSWSSTGALVNLPAIVHRPGGYRLACPRDQGIRHVQQYHCRHQAGDRRPFHRCRSLVRQDLELGDPGQSHGRLHSA